MVLFVNYGGSKRFFAVGDAFFSRSAGKP